MLRYILILNAFPAFCAARGSRGVGPDYPATKGEVVGVTCPFLWDIVARYSHLFARQSRLAQRRPNHGHERRRMGGLHVDLKGPCENYPHLGMNESYNLTIARVSTLQSSSIWGILRGLQTLLHSFYLSDDYREILINGTNIVDSPRFPHRGLLLDTSRHYISLQNILLILDAMEMNKMNVFHWHIVDDESFPYQSQKFPELSEYAAYYPTMVYSAADIAVVVKHARERGIRVIPEFDVPGHTLSWGESHPEILTKCFDGNGNMMGVLNPVENATFALLGALVKEVQRLFPDASFHVGGDEVFSSCWDLDPTVQAYVTEHSMSTADLLPMFMNKLFALLGGNSQPIVWQEVFENMVLPATIPVQVWKSDSDNGKRNLNKVLEAGNKAILSAPWYLDHLNKGCWDYYRHTDPLAMVNNKALGHNVLGGEACMWAEAIDDRNVISRIWPRASTVAEVLWSSPPFDASYHSPNKNRLEEHTCRMLRFDIGAQPPNERPGFCVNEPNHF